MKKVLMFLKWWFRYVAISCIIYVASQSSLEIAEHYVNKTKKEKGMKYDKRKADKEIRYKPIIILAFRNYKQIIDLYASLTK